MASYNTPGIYIHDIKSGSSILSSNSSSVGVMLGATRSGKLGEVQLVTSFTEFVQEYANGLDTPFMSDSYLPYAVHGFFTNGGKYLYIGRIAHSTATKATKTTTNTKITATAKYEGSWGNDIKITITKNADWDATNLVYDVLVEVGSSDSATIIEVTLADIESKVMSNTKVANWLSVFTVDSTTSALEEEVIQLAGGVDGVTDMTDSDITNALTMLSGAEEATLVAVPGHTSNAVNNALMAYCDEHNMFPILDMPMGSTISATRTYRKSISAFGGCLCYPWGIINDTLTEAPKKVPTCGHVMGVYARVIEERGVHKAPAGIDAVVRGFIDLEKVLTNDEVGLLNPVGVISIMPKTNAGIVVWGARSLNPENLMKYVSDVLINYQIKKSLLQLTQFAIFEPNDEVLWSRVSSVCKDYLEGLRKQGALKGTSDEAYYVTVNDTNNTPATIANGELHVEIGYAPNKPAEYIIINLAHSIES